MTKEIPHAKLLVPKDMINKALHNGLSETFLMMSNSQTYSHEIMTLLKDTYTDVENDLFVIGIFMMFLQREYDFKEAMDERYAILSPRIFTAPILNALLEMNPKVMGQAWEAIMSGAKEEAEKLPQTGNELDDFYRCSRCGGHNESCRCPEETQTEEA